jgi:hypothetical protein
MLDGTQLVYGSYMPQLSLPLVRKISLFSNITAVSCLRQLRPDLRFSKPVGAYVGTWCSNTGCCNWQICFDKNGDLA